MMGLLPNPLPSHPKPSDRDAMIDWARALLKSRDFVIIDTETTGLGHTDEVVQIGIMDSDGVELVDSLVKPEKPRRMPARAKAVHGISMKMLANAPTFHEVLPQIMSSIAGRCVVCFNAAFDLRVMEQTAQKYDPSRHGVRFNVRSKCAMIAYAQFIGEQRKAGSASYAWQRLPRLDDGKHKAIDDCRLTLDLIREIAQTPKQGEMIKFKIGIIAESGSLEPAFSLRTTF
jgi:DNA polymerase III subunit epsilon